MVAYLDKINHKHKVMKPILVISLLFLALSGCKSNDNPAVANDIVMPSARANVPDKQYAKKDEANPAIAIDTSKKLIKEGSISFRQVI